jgi:hypothetical protein
LQQTLRGCSSSRKISGLTPTSCDNATMSTEVAPKGRDGIFGKAMSSRVGFKRLVVCARGMRDGVDDTELLVDSYPHGAGFVAACTR